MATLHPMAFAYALHIPGVEATLLREILLKINAQYAELRRKGGEAIDFDYLAQEVIRDNVVEDLFSFGNYSKAVRTYYTKKKELSKITFSVSTANAHCVRIQVLPAGFFIDFRALKANGKLEEGNVRYGSHVVPDGVVADTSDKKLLEKACKYALRVMNTYRKPKRKRKR